MKTVSKSCSNTGVKINIETAMNKQCLITGIKKLE